LEPDARKRRERAAPTEERHIPALRIEGARSIEAKPGLRGARALATRSGTIVREWLEILTSRGFSAEVHAKRR
jgi:hypothetical protein